MPKLNFEEKPLIKRKLTFDINKLLSGLFRFAVAYFDPIKASSNIVSGVSDIIKSIQIKDNEGLGSKAYQLLLFSLSEAGAKILEDYGRKDEFKEIISKDGFKEVIIKGERAKILRFDDNFLTNPSEHPFIKQFVTNFKSGILGQGVPEEMIYGLEEKIKSYYLEAFHRRFSTNIGEYSALENLLVNSTTPAYRREQEWNDYRAVLNKQVYDPIFDEVFGLRQIYVQLNAYYKEEIRVDNKSILEEKDESEQRMIEKKSKNEKTIICKIEKELDEWIEKGNTKDGLKIITGDPGSGKSTLAKVWVSKLAERNKRVLLISLNQVRKSTQPEEVIQEFINSKIHRFNHNPYELLGKEENTPLLVVFDGLDE